MIDVEMIELRLSKLKECAKFLKSCQKYSQAEFVNNIMLRSAVERNFQLAIECIIDIGEILISNLNLKKPNDSRDVVDILGENKVLPKRFAFYLAPIAGFRNALVHDYLKIDYKKVYNHLQNDLIDFDKFARYIVAFLKKKSILKLI